MRALTSVAISGVTGIYVLLTCVLGSTPPPVWPTEVQAYRALLSNLSKNTSVWSTAARSLRTFMQANDKNYPLYHMTAPEGWNNDPNGVIFDRHTVRIAASTHIQSSSHAVTSATRGCTIAFTSTIQHMPTGVGMAKLHVPGGRLCRGIWSTGRTGLGSTRTPPGTSTVSSQATACSTARIRGQSASIPTIRAQSWVSQPLSTPALAIVQTGTCRVRRSHCADSHIGRLRNFG